VPALLLRSGSKIDASFGSLFFRLGGSNSSSEIEKSDWVMGLTGGESESESESESLRILRSGRKGVVVLAIVIINADLYVNCN
jgi:hypothetical protein